METQNTATTSFSTVAGKPRRKRSPKALADALRNFDSLPGSAHVRLPTVAALLGVSPATVWRRAKSGAIPRPVNLGGNVTAWNVGALRQSLARFAGGAQ